MKNKLGLKSSLTGTPSKIFEDVELKNLERNVRFSFRSCNQKDYCIRKLDAHEISRFYERLAYFENMTWKTAKSLPRDKGFSTEKKESENHKFLKGFYDNYSFFFHFRVNGTDKEFRVFATQHEDLCCLLLLDREGSLNHK
jgi:hypothetical protein